MGCKARIEVVEVAESELCVPWVVCLGEDGRHLLIARDTCSARQILDALALMQRECGAATERDNGPASVA